jgi:1-deoxy-D-xylulose-5-phosphate reductoisomerase
MTRQIVILGSTGSIGVNALAVLRKLNGKAGDVRQAGTAPGGGRPPKFGVLGLSTHANVNLLKSQIAEFRPRFAVVSDPRGAAELAAWARKAAPKLKVLRGVEGLQRLAREPKADVVLSSVVGSVGLLPLVSALQAGKKVALANKEALIVAGGLLMAMAQRHGAEIIPVDSEHSAIFQCLQGHRHPPGRANGGSDVRRIVLTASGGAFYRRKGSLDSVTPREALNHPTWKMGEKITVDCATLTNKGLEAIEAHHLFGVPLEDVHIVIHPQSIVHSLVEFKDGAMLAQLSHPDMRLPIQYALTHPARLPTNIRPLELERIRTLDFHRPDFGRFPCLAMALKAGRLGGTWPAVFNGANEVAVRGFLDGRLSFLGIPRTLERVMSAFRRETGPASDGASFNGHRSLNLDQILEADRWAREKVEALL